MRAAGPGAFGVGAHLLFVEDADAVVCGGGEGFEEGGAVFCPWGAVGVVAAVVFISWVIFLGEG